MKEEIENRPEWASVWTFPSGLRLNESEPSAYDLARQFRVRMPARSLVLGAQVVSGELVVIAGVHADMVGDEPDERVFVVRTTAQRFDFAEGGRYLASVQACGHLLHVWEITPSLVQSMSEELEHAIAIRRAVRGAMELMKEIEGDEEALDDGADSV